MLIECTKAVYFQRFKLEYFEPFFPEIKPQNVHSLPHSLRFFLHGIEYVIFRLTVFCQQMFFISWIIITRHTLGGFFKLLETPEFVNNG